MTLETHYDIPDHVIAREVGGETVILDLKRGIYCGLNEVGARYWALLVSGMSVESAIQTLHGEYDVGHVVLEGDILSLTKELVSKSLVSKCGPKATADE